jgi:hypothetical protein
MYDSQSESTLDDFKRQGLINGSLSEANAHARASSNRVSPGFSWEDFESVDVRGRIVESTGGKKEANPLVSRHVQARKIWTMRLLWITE